MIPLRMGEETRSQHALYHFIDISLYVMLGQQLFDMWNVVVKNVIDKPNYTGGGQLGYKELSKIWCCPVHNRSARM